jgi:hypothetical protein
MATKSNLLLKHLQIVGSITGREAMIEYDIQSLTKEIHRLRQKGYVINTVGKAHPVKGVRYGRFFLISEPVS